MSSMSSLFSPQSWRVVTGVVFAAAGLSLGACSSDASVAEPFKHPVLVMTVGEDGALMGRERSVPAVVVARYASDIGFQVAGRISKRSVELGQVVRKGQVLLQLDSSDYQLASAAAQDQVLVAKAQYDQASADAKRMITLVTAGAISVAESERQTARADAAKAQFHQAKRQADLSRNRLRYASLVAPYDGVITAIRAEAGQVVGEGVPVVSMAKPGEMEVAADIPESLMSSVSKQSAQADIFGASPARVAVHLRELSPTASQPLRTYRARFSLVDVTPQQLAQLHLGMTAQVILTSTGAASTATILPATALVKARDEVSVWLVNDRSATLQKQPVNVLRYENDLVAVSGVPNGAKVVIAGVQKLDAKMQVRAIERSGAGLNLPPSAGAHP
ncbi:MAG: efflux RND transporter periplasmic adaptor subunit [Paraperlucidibaca sp.]